MRAAVTVRVEWEMGHRLPHHHGACRNLHGHHYAAEATLEGVVSTKRGATGEGMVTDFGPARAALRHEVAQLDHLFLVHDDDELLDALENLPGVVVVTFVPTAENIATALLGALRRAVENPDGPSLSDVTVENLRLYETPTAWVDVAARGEA